MTHILGDTPSGRLHKALVETKKASRVYGYNFQLHDPGVAMLGAEVRKEDSLEEARQAYLSTIEDIRREPAQSGGGGAGEDAVAEKHRLGSQRRESSGA